MNGSWVQKSITDIAFINRTVLPENTDPETKIEYFDISSASDLAPEPSEVRFGDAPSRARRKAENGDVIYSCVRPLLRRIFRANGNPNAVYSTGYAVIHAKKSYSNEFLFQIFQTHDFEKKVHARLTGSGYPAISASDLGEIIASFPPLPEQQKIAEILQTWDKAIEKTARLIAAKERRIAQIARTFFLPCHPTSQRKESDWREFELGDVFKERIEGGAAKDRLLSITMSEGVIDREEVGRKDTSNDDKSKYKLILPGDIGYNTMRMWQGVSGLSALRGIVSPAYTIVTPDNVNIDAHYAAHLFKSRRMVFDFERYSQGLTSDTWNLKFPAFSEIKVFLPPIEKQRKQAALLNAMRDEIAVMRQQKDSLSRQKRGLMQKLLTGKWRLKLTGGSS